MDAPLSVFRLIASEFASIEDEVVLQWMELSIPHLSKKRFGSRYNEALALLTAHKMKLANVGVVEGEDPLFTVSKIGAGNLMRVGSYSEGSVSLSLNSGAGQYTGINAEYGLTNYGIQLQTILRNVMAIISAGETRY